MRKDGNMQSRKFRPEGPTFSSHWLDSSRSRSDCPERSNATHDFGKQGAIWSWMAATIYGQTYWESSGFLKQSSRRKSSRSTSFMYSSGDSDQQIWRGKRDSIHSGPKSSMISLSVVHWTRKSVGLEIYLFFWTRKNWETTQHKISTLSHSKRKKCVYTNYDNNSQFIPPAAT